MPSSNRMSRENRQREKAGYLYLIYKHMGPERSLTKLYDIVTTMGLRISLKTIKRYSVIYEWQRTLLEEMSRDNRQHEKDILLLVDKMNERDAMTAQGMMNLAVAAINKFQEELNHKKSLGLPQTLDMSIQDICRLAEAAQRMERLARGQVITRTEIWIDIAATVVQEFALIFLAVNNIEDKELRQREFVRLSDEMMDRYYSNTVKQKITITDKNKD